MVRTEGNRRRLVMLAAALALALLAFGLLGVATASGPDIPEREIQFQPIEEQVTKLISPIRCPDRMCPDDGRGCRCWGGDPPPVRLLIGEPGAPILTE